MSDNLRKYFTTGEFAKICRVKKQTLFHYDEIGLLTPEIKTAKGYRYYSYQQYEVFAVIELLKELKMPLKEIRAFLQNKTPIESIELLEQQSQLIEQKIHNLAHLRKILDTKIAITKNALQTDFENITVVHSEEENLLISESTLDTSDKVFLKTVSNFINYSDNYELYTGHPIGGMLHRDKMMERDFENYSFLYTKMKNSWQGENLWKKPKGLYIVGYHIGDEMNIFETYDRMIAYSKEQHLQLNGYSYEEYILDAVSVNDLENYVTKIMIEVVKG
ncbi:MerR family transcriptional regulator [Viridibacillus sp. YIM B01967]|uniref:MerR family transcriptional regulator n=1 Tax=Viridibacillus soli TaxID=2798301 RepID=A0ABS1H2M9_9BACL|nr:MerR family transcriptional regulator [Viridibacillus soli]MBK3493666.1 MerR family transcriptional regulator [Viridibacillus soli]